MLSDGSFLFLHSMKQRDQAFTKLAFEIGKTHRGKTSQKCVRAIEKVQPIALTEGRDSRFEQLRRLRQSHRGVGGVVRIQGAGNRQNAQERVTISKWSCECLRHMIHRPSPPPLLERPVHLVDVLNEQTLEHGQQEMLPRWEVQVNRS